MLDEASLASVRLVLDEEGSDAGELEELTTKLRRQILDLDVESVERAVGEAPEGSRGVVGAAVGSLVVTLGNSPQLLSSIVTTVMTWLSGHKGRTIRMTIDGDTLALGGLSSADQSRLIDSWIDRHARPASS